MRKPTPTTVIALLALFVALGGVGLAANGQSLILGSANNAATAQTAVTGTTPQAAFAVTNNGGGIPLKLTAPSGKPPLVINSPTKVANLNADQLDNLDSSYFLPKTGTAANSNNLGGQLPSYYLPATGKAADSDTLDGLDSTDFAPTGLTWTAAPLADYGDYYWGNWNSGWSQAEYAKDPFGIVHLKGLVTCHGAIHCLVPPAIFVLPPGYRPALWSVFATLSNDESARITIDPNGNVLPSIWHNNWISLDGITFPAA
jgi:hypothetical protein